MAMFSGEAGPGPKYLVPGIPPLMHVLHSSHRLFTSGERLSQFP
jgi:hypothetical protein